MTASHRRVSQRALEELLWSYNRNPGVQPLGQALHNVFVVGYDNDLLQEKDNDKALALFAERYVAKG